MNRILLTVTRRLRLRCSPVPEGHTIHRLAKDHTRDLVRQRTEVSSPQGRMTLGAALVNGQVLRKVDPYGKHLFYRWDNDITIHVHLGLFGKFRREATPASPPRDTVRMRISGERWTVSLTGPTDCRVVSEDEEIVIRDRLGPDPIRVDADPDIAWTRLSKRRISIGQALLDQKVMAGVGNVYRAEALFVNGIHPNRLANTLTRTEFDELWITIATMLRQGVKDARIITVDPAELDKTRRQMRSKEAVYVYKQSFCRRCATPIDRWDLAGRWAYACPTCQRPE